MDGTFDDSAVYDLICAMDTVGVFQVESRAQAQVLPRLQPRCFNDLIVCISLIRPGPIQGDMVHPYLRRRLGHEPVTYFHPLLEAALAETLGVILFQEQVLKVARDLAGFTPGEGELLRRALGAKDHGRVVEGLREAFIRGAADNGVDAETAELDFNKLRAFGGYSFPKSHAAAFAVLVYRSAWLKVYHSQAFFVALLNHQPMGFWTPAVLINDAKRRAISVHGVDLHHSTWRCTVEGEAIRLGFNYVREITADQAEAIRSARPFRDPAKAPKILIVTEKLLTGYDAPVAYCMYLDKPLKDHTLLQAIARVNRPYQGKKNGLIVDYIGIFRNLQRALAFDQSSLSKGLIDLEALKQQFAVLLEEVAEQVDPIQPDALDGRIERIIQHFSDVELRERFIHTFKELEIAYEVISPDPFLRPYIDDYAAVADIYQTVYAYFDPKAQQRRLERDLLKKTEQLIRSHIDSSSVASPLPLYPINKHIADVIAADNIPEQVKVVNLQRSLITHIQDNLDSQPFLVSIGEEVEKIIDQLHQRQITAESALAALQDRAQEIANAQDEQANSSLDNLAFSLRMVLRASDLQTGEPTLFDSLSADLSRYLRENEGWKFNQQLTAKVRLEIYRRLMPLVQPFDAVRANKIVDDLMKMHRITG